jgi:glycosyltransferase 2 family protein
VSSPRARAGARTSTSHEETAPAPGSHPALGSSVFSFRTILRVVAGLAAGCLVAILAGWGLGVRVKDALGYAAGVSPWLVVGCVASGFVVFAFQSLRWHSVMRPLLGLRYLQAYRAQVVGFMFNAILPARGGDLLRVQYLGRRTGKSRATILGTEIVDRWLDWWGWIPAFLVFCLVSHPPFWLYKALGIFGAILLTWAGAMVALTKRGFRPRPESRLGKVWVALQTGMGAFRQPRTWVIALLLAPLPWLWESMVICLAARGFGIQLNLLMAFSVLIGFNLAMVVPSPGAIGSIEAGGTAALIFFGADQSQALAFMVIYHFSQLLPGVAAGVLILVSEGERLFGKSAAPLKDGAEAAPG